MSAFRRFWMSMAVAVLATFFAGNVAAIEIESVTSPGGVTAWLARDASVPVISLRFAFRGGASFDPAGKEGRAEMVAALLDEGAGDLDSQAFQNKLDDISASISFDADADRLVGSLGSLRTGRETAFALLGLALTAPRFDEDAVERIRAQMISAFEVAQKNPRTMAGQRWFAAVFPDHPYGRPTSGTRSSIEGLRRADFSDFIASRLARDVLVVGVSGDITAAELAPLLDVAFGGLPAAAAADRLAEADPRNAGTLVVPFDVPQSVVMFGHGGVKRDDPDYYAAAVMNHILGGSGFSSRLTREIREKRGLAYSVHSALVTRRAGGVLIGTVATANSRVAESVALVRAEWRRMFEEGVEADELAEAKTYITGSYPLRFTSTGAIAGMLAAIQGEGLGIDYIDRRNRLIEAVNAADIRRVARRLLRPDGLTIVVVGKPEGIKPG